MPSSPRFRLLLAGGFSAAFVLLSLAVSQSTTDQLDDRTRQVFRPDDIWSTNQLIFGNVVDGLEPRVSLGILAAVALSAAVLRRSLVPLVFAAGLCFVAATLTIVSKAAVSRVDTHGDVGGYGGAFPSGHVVMLLVSLGGCVLLLRAHSRLWDWLAVGAVTATMGVSLLFLATHWFTDVVGGALLGTAVVAVASLLPGRPRAAGNRVVDHASAPDVPVHVEDHP